MAERGSLSDNNELMNIVLYCIVNIVNSDWSTSMEDRHPSETIPVLLHRLFMRMTLKLILI